MKINDFQLERFFAKYEFKAPYLLSSSDCESFSVNEILEMAGDDTDMGDLWLGYTESLGDPELRGEIVDLYQNISSDEVIVTAGAEEAIFVFMNVALEEDDHVICMFPAYQSLFEIANSIGCEVSHWELKEENGWEPDLNELRDAIRPNTRAIIINTPHNPTGYLFSQKKLEEVIEVARKNDLYLFSDEVYKFLEHDEKDRLPSVCDHYEKGISLGVMSKSFGLAGLRIGWIATQDEELYREFASFKDYTSICNSAPSEYLAIRALQNKDKLVKRNLGIIEENMELLDQFFEKYDDLFEWQKPKAGSIAFPRLTIDEPIEEFCIKLVEETGVLLLPGNYYFAGDKNFRIGFGRKNMPEALSILDDYLEKNYR